MNLEEMKKEVKKRELQEKLKKLGGKMSKEKHEDSSKRVEKEIDSLERKRANLPTGFKGFIQGKALNFELNQRRKFLRDKETLKRMTITANMQREMAKVKEDIHGLRERNTITFDSLMKRGIKI